MTGRKIISLIIILFLVIILIPAIVFIKKEHNKLYVIFTVDTEDKRGHEPNLIEGDLTKFGIKENCGVNYIMDTFEKFGKKAVFFVNIYEHSLYNENYMPDLLKRIDNRGHEVGLHTHKDNRIITKELKDSSLEEQIKIYKYGSDYVEKATGTRPTSYRGGGYMCNDNTFMALKQTGFKYDSSLFYGQIGRNNISFKYQNQPIRVDGITSLPIVTVYTEKGWKKLDINFLNADEIIQSLELMRKSGDFKVAQIMFHSFSFLDQANKKNKKVLINEGDRNTAIFDRKIYGEDKKAKENLEKVLSYLSKSKNYEVITFHDLDKLKLRLPRQKKDSIIYLNEDTSLAIRKSDFSYALPSDNKIEITNNFNGKLLKYIWYINNCKTGERVKQIRTTDNKLIYEFSPAYNGTYKVSTRVYGEKGKIGIIIYDIDIKNGKISEVRYH